MSNEKLSTMKRAALLLTCGAVILLFSIGNPELAFADNKGFIGGGISAGIEMLKTLTTVLFLPLGVIIASSKIIYIAIVGGLLGMDPLNIIKTGDSGLTGTDISHADIQTALKQHMWGFAKGLAWVAGLFVIFRLALNFAAMLADQAEANFGTGGDTSGQEGQGALDKSMKDKADETAKRTGLNP